MILDEYTEFADATALNTGAAGTYNVGDLIDTTDAGLDDVDNIYLVIQVSTTVDSSGDGVTLQFKLVSDATSTVSTTTATVHYTSAVIAQATAVAGATLVTIALPKGTYERYLGIQQVTAVEAVTAGAINAFLTARPETWRSFADGSN